MLDSKLTEWRNNFNESSADKNLRCCNLMRTCKTAQEAKGLNDFFGPRLTIEVLVAVIVVICECVEVS